MTRFAEEFQGTAFAQLQSTFGEACKLRQVAGRTRADSGILSAGTATDTSFIGVRRKVTRSEVAQGGGRVKVEDAVFDASADDLGAVIPAVGDVVLAGDSYSELWRVVYTAKTSGGIWQLFARL